MGQPMPAQHASVVLRSHFNLVRTLLAIAMAAVLGGLMLAAPARAHTPGSAARGLTLAEAESATRAALAPLAVDALEGQICRSLVEVKRSRANRGVVKTRVIAGQFCMSFDPTLSTVRAAVVHASAVPKSARALAQQARRQLEATPRVSVLSTTLQCRTERLCDVVYVLRQRGRLVAYAGQIKIGPRGDRAHFRGLTGLRRI